MPDIKLDISSIVEAAVDYTSPLGPLSINMLSPEEMAAHVFGAVRETEDPREAYLQQVAQQHRDDQAAQAYAAAVAERKRRREAREALRRQRLEQARKKRAKQKKHKKRGR